MPAGGTVEEYLVSGLYSRNFKTDPKKRRRIEKIFRKSPYRCTGLQYMLNKDHGLK